MRIYFDLESTNLLNNSSIDYTQLPYRLKDGYKVHCLVAKNVDTGQVWKFRPHNIEKVKQLFSKTTEVIGHNIINFDMRVLQLVFGIDFEIDLEGDQDKVMGRPCTITDTLVISRLLNPDRFGGHSLDSWGKRTGLLKGDYGKQQNAWDVFTPEMLDYCVQDVEVTEATYKALMEEWGDWDWSDAYKTEKITAYLVGVSEHYGYKFDKVLANKALTDFNVLMEQIEQDVEPKLPSKKMGKTAQERFIPPKNQLKKSGEPSANMVKFAERLGGVITEDGLEYIFEYKGRSWNLPMPQEPVEDTEPMRLANQSDMKEWLVTEGWVPTTWSEVDLTIDNKKQKVSPDKFKEKVYRYCKESNESPFGRYRCKHLGVGSVRQMYIKMMQHNLKRPLKVITSPKFTVNADKDLCPNLEAMGSAMGFVSDVAKWLTLRHRRNAILSTTGKTGFLVNVKDDGRIPTPANSCGCSTSRFTHSVVCNIPRVTSLYGDIMRSLFGVDTNDRQQIGYDFTSLEARVEGHFTRPFKGGVAYSESLLAEKPQDIHSVNSIKMGVTRDEAKTMKYAISYGAQPNKLAAQMNWSIDHAKSVFESFWDAASPLKDLKNKLTREWKANDKKFIRGIDGRKLYIRSEHSIVNMLFQSTGVIAAKKANILHCQDLQTRGLLFNPFKDSSTYGKSIVMIMYHDEAQFDVCKSLIEEYVFEDEFSCKNFKIDGKILGDPYKNKDGKWVRHYSIVGELASLYAEKAAKYYGMDVGLAADYIVGDNWKVCH